MGKRKKSSKKPAPNAARRKQPLDTTFTCLFCHHDNSVTVRMDKKDGVAYLSCKVCDQRYQGKVNHLTEPIDIYAEWMDACDAAQDEAPPPRPTASSSRPRAPPQRAEISDSDDD
ncbi:hypothetical protein GGG16DRAFT_46821 [Schizophyllum commune]|uniref:Transcription elongation factor 1 homolog n=1 Tax=Schizophyllum commune (strain H4-8 / FGSC 9210) TaxID=578458 RepID=D8PT10_SCHCM|nr:Elf1-domain-containing protein [Schizophyllum commune H4-8]KAI5899475.1 Elf1-domain-containing protein [Schizophyllum commune H4-8]